jgi:hypothetical protein
MSSRPLPASVPCESSNAQWRDSGAKGASGTSRRLKSATSVGRGSACGSIVPDTSRRPSSRILHATSKRVGDERGRGSLLMLVAWTFRSSRRSGGRSFESTYTVFPSSLRRASTFSASVLLRKGRVGRRAGHRAVRGEGQFALLKTLSASTGRRSPTAKPPSAWRGRAHPARGGSVGAGRTRQMTPGERTPSATGHPPLTRRDGHHAAGSRRHQPA